MKQLFLLACFLFLSSSLTFAQPLTNRNLAAEQLFLYGQAVYDRGDYPQAAVIISRVLRMDPNHPEARKYAAILNKKGQNIDIPSITQNAEPAPSEEGLIPKPQSNRIKVTARKEPQKTVQPAAAPVPVVMDKGNDDLKQGIQEADETINRLKDEISVLRNQISQGQKNFEAARLQPLK